MLVYCAERYDSIELRIGSTPVADGGDENPVCDSQATIIGEEGQKRFLVYRCGSGAVGEYVTLRLSEPGVALTICEAMVFNSDKQPTTILRPQLKAEENTMGNYCPDPLAGACKTYEDEGMSADDAALTAFMQGPIACGKGFFCRMKRDPAGISGGMTGSNGDRFNNNRNYGYW